MHKLTQIGEFLETLIRRKFKLFLLACVLLGVFIFLGITLVRIFSKPQISEGLIGVVEENSLPEMITDLVASSIVGIDASGKPYGKLAESWNVNPEGTIYTVKLRKNLFWTDGTPIKSADISLNLPDVETSYPDDFTIQYKLKDSFSPFVTLLNKPVFKKNDQNHPDGHIGVGIYKIDQIKKDNDYVKKVVLKPVKDASLPDIVFRFYPNEKIAHSALKIGEIQSIFGVNDLADFSTQNNVSEFSKVSYRQIVTIFYNTKDPILSDENYRLALSYGAPVINKETRAKTSIPPGSWAYNDEVKEYLDNAELAKSSLAKVKNGKDSPVVLTVTSSLRSSGEKVVEAWNKLGIKAVLRVESGIPQNFQALLITQNIPVDPDQYSLWHSTQLQTNVSQIASPRIDKDLEDGRKSVDMEVRKERYLDFQKVLLDRAPAAFLYFPKYNVVYLKKIEPLLKKVLDLQLSSI